MSTDTQAKQQDGPFVVRFEVTGPDAMRMAIMLRQVAFLFFRSVDMFADKDGSCTVVCVADKEHQDALQKLREEIQSIVDRHQWRAQALISSVPWKLWLQRTEHVLQNPANVEKVAHLFIRGQFQPEGRNDGSAEDGF